VIWFLKLPLDEAWLPKPRKHAITSLKSIVDVKYLHKGGRTGLSEALEDSPMRFLNLDQGAAWQAFMQNR